MALIKDFGLPPFNIKIASESGVVSQAFRLFFTNMFKLYTLTGTGSPEGVVHAVSGQEYMDLTGTAGSIKYIKRDDEVAGDSKLGWIAI